MFDDEASGEFEFPVVPLEYDRDSYRAGMEIGELKVMLSTRQVSALALSVRDSNLRAADLIAMAYGYVVQAYESHGGFTEIEVRKSEAEIS